MAFSDSPKKTFSPLFITKTQSAALRAEGILCSTAITHFPSFARALRRVIREISFDISYNIIRNLYFDCDRADAGEKLLKEALDAFGTSEKVYAFFHYFGMTCFARHGKLCEKNNIDVVITASIDADEAPDFIKKYV